MSDHQIHIDDMDMLGKAFNFAGAVAVFISGWILKLVTGKINAVDDTLTSHGERLTRIECTYISRSDLDDVLEVLQEDLKTSFDRAHARIDRLYDPALTGRAPCRDIRNEK